jgi:methylglutaconyl-CoA hydratase
MVWTGNTQNITTSAQTVPVGQFQFANVCSNKANLTEITRAMAEPTVLFELDNRGVATVTLNRPQRNNAYNRELLETATNLLSQAETDDSIRLLLLRGAGRHFQAGVDLDWAAEVSAGSESDNLEASRLTAEFVRKLDTCPRPVLALVHGAVIGGGTGIVAACDIVIASNTATFAISEARWGLVANPIFPQLREAIGARNLRRYALSCERFDAFRARDIGLVHEVCEHDQLLDTAEPIIEGLLHAGPQALKASKHAMSQLAQQQVDDDLWQQLIATHAAKRLSAEAAEGINSFREKRAPAWYPEPEKPSQLR